MNFVNPFEVAKGNVSVLRPKLDKESKSIVKAYLNILAVKIKNHYPHTISINNTIDKELKSVLENIDKEEIKCTE